MTSTAAVLATVLLSCCCPSVIAQEGGAASPEMRSKALAAVFHDAWEDRLKHDPEYASTLGDKRYNDDLTDYSAGEVNASLARGRGFIDRLGAIDTSGLAEQDQLSAELMLRSLIDDQEGARFKAWEMPVNQFSGFHTEMPRLAGELSFETAKDFDDWTARLLKIPHAFVQIETNMMLGMDEHRVPPRYLMEKVLAQTQAIAAQKPSESPFALPLAKFPATVGAVEQRRIRGEMLDAITQSVLPAYERFAKFLTAQYIPACRADPGVSALPDGDAYYAYLVRKSTTLDKTPAEIHQIGLDEVKRDEGEMLAIVHKLGFSDLQSFSTALKANAKEHPSSAEALLDAYRGHEDVMTAKLPQLFGRLPKAKLEVVAMPAYIERDQAAAFYDEGSPDGRRPGRVGVNTYHFADRSLAPVEAVSYHEGVPGHHLQISIAQEITSLPAFRQHSYYTAYTEGWGLYSERLGKEVGFYQDPYSDYGRLEADIWRAIRLVVDTGVHSQHWTRQQMVDYFHEHSAIDETNVQAEVDRYIGWPAQALGYKMGQLEIVQARARAQAALGSRFDIRAFHDEVIGSGALPLDVLDRRLDRWIAAQKR